VANFCGRSTLPQLLALAQASDLFITVDTGTAHLAALTETPLISIFIWTNPALWPPQSPLAQLMCYDWALARFRLTASDGPWQTAPCITPEMVFRKAGEVLGC
jgi:ADP-heptose:LPS heptosyltransferase